MLLNVVVNSVFLSFHFLVFSTPPPGLGQHVARMWKLLWIELDERFHFEWTPKIFQDRFLIILIISNSNFRLFPSSLSNECKLRWYASVCYLAGIILLVSFVYPVSGTVMTDQINNGTLLEWRVYCKNKCAFNTKSLKVR